ncbi:MAG: hypothetical protein AB7K09_13965 [Planctomycetota bacterium]
MPLVDVPLPEPSEAALPAAIARLLADADRRIARFHQTHRNSPVAGYVNSDFTMSWRVIDAVVRSGLAPGPAFCEWGSGFGVVTVIAATLGLDAVGIEINADLVEESEELAAAHDAECDFVCGNFVPTDGQEMADGQDGFDASGGQDAWTELEMDPSDFDLVYVFPWPDEVSMVQSLFEAFAADDALLITCRGMDGMQLQRKVRRSRRGQ